ncbi:DNA-binding protein D-ETS-4-like isoform X2 [Stegostoma tigrinum]|uniref:DNA-binding protein D-ETS-4-like isoform X2 n=1 Tax=Stegostoma tigrinum TaxID=3053191 RepID=UPI00286FC77B|nr:DNA-binding protein D-ETS-4-like isoform X2 [Stegostoma tigrinum]
MNTEFRCHPVFQQLPFMWNTLDLESNGVFLDGMLLPVNGTVKSQTIDCINSEEMGRKEAAVKSDPEGVPAPRGTHLWEFIRDVLLDSDKNPGLLKWEDRSEGVFRFLKSEAVAQLCGKKKNNSSMTYEKLSRAMRSGPAVMPLLWLLLLLSFDGSSHSSVSA